MKFAVPFVIGAVANVGAAVAAPQAKIEDCGWLIQRDATLVQEPDASLKPSDPAPLPSPPADAKAAYCQRDTMMSYVGDERLLKLSLPFVIRSNGREGVLEANPTVMFNYHLEGDRYLPGRASQ